MKKIDVTNPRGAEAFFSDKLLWPPVGGGPSPSTADETTGEHGGSFVAAEIVDRCESIDKERGAERMKKTTGR